MIASKKRTLVAWAVSVPLWVAGWILIGSPSLWSAEAAGVVLIGLSSVVPVISLEQR